MPSPLETVRDILLALAERASDPPGEERSSGWRGVCYLTPDELVRLRAALATPPPDTAALTRVVRFAALGLDPDTPDDRTVARYNDTRLTAGEIRRALEAL